ncbi:MAG TPA: hypothetical protein VGC71_05790 [Gaiellales bacterium]|jgi:hypothetical protein
MQTARLRSWVVTGAVAAGAALGAAGIASAASGGSSGSTSPAQRRPPMVDPAQLAHGPGETLLTGTTASRVTAAALKAVPGATVIRVETDSSGAAYEAHLRKADGSYVTAEMDSSFAVRATEAGFGGGLGGPPGAPPAQ